LPDDRTSAGDTDQDQKADLPPGCRTSPLSI
jgi:hypothetical protein